MSDDLRMTDLERRVDGLSQRVALLERNAGPGWQPAATPARAAAGTTDVPAPPAPAPAPTPVAAPKGYWVPTQPLPGSPPGAPPGRSAAFDITPSRVLAMAGGLILLLGIGYLVRFAVAQGWLGPEVRIVLALMASGLIAGVGIRLERRGDTRLVGQICTVTGVAGAYTAVVAATAGYRMLPDIVGFLVVAAIAATAVARGVWARSQWVAALGVGGALAAPAVVNAVPAAVTLALLVVLVAGGLEVAGRERWPVISAIALLVVTPQLWTVATGTPPLLVGLGLMGACAALFLRVALRHDRDGAGPGFAPPLLVANALSAAAAGSWLLGDAPGVSADATAWWLAAIGGVHLLASVVVSRRNAASPAAMLAAIVGFVALDVAVLLLLDGYPVQLAFLVGAGAALLAGHAMRLLRNIARAGLVVQLGAVGLHAVAVDLSRAATGSLEAVVLVIVCAGVAVALAAAARHLGRQTALAAAVVPLGVGFLRLLTFEAPPSALLDGPQNLLAAIAMCLALTAGLAALGWLHRRFFVVAVAVANYAVSVAAVAMDPEGLGRVALTGLWASGGAAALILGRRHARPDARRAGGALLTAALSKALLIDTVTLDGTNRAAALLLCGTVLITTAVVEARAVAKSPPPRPLPQ